MTGSIARKVHLGLLGVDPAERTVGDVDLVVEGANSLPDSLATGFLCPHVHPAAPAGGVLIQLVHLQDAVRFDAFKAADGALARSSSNPVRRVLRPGSCPGKPLCQGGRPPHEAWPRRDDAAKHADDLNRLRGHADAVLMEQA